MHQSALLPNLYSGFGDVEAGVEPLQHWKNRTVYLTQDIVKATTIARGMAPDLVPQLVQAQVKVDEAKALIAAEETAGQWTRFRETRIDAALLGARERYDAAAMQARLRGIGFPSLSTWTQSPATSAGKRPLQAPPAPAGQDADPKPNGAPPGGDDSASQGATTMGLGTPMLLGVGVIGLLWFMGTRR